MESKKCKTCHVEKPIDEFSLNMIKPSGARVYRASCKVCNARIVKENRLIKKGKQEPVTKKKKVKHEAEKVEIKKPEVETPVKTSCKCCFNDEQIKLLLNLINISDIDVDKKLRKAKTLNINESLLIKLTKYSNSFSKKINLSDAINHILKEFFL